MRVSDLFSAEACQAVRAAYQNEGNVHTFVTSRLGLLVQRPGDCPRCALSLAVFEETGKIIDSAPHASAIMRALKIPATNNVVRDVLVEFINEQSVSRDAIIDAFTKG